MRLKTLLAATALAGLTGGTAMGQTVTLEAPGADDTLTGILEQASLSVALAADEEAQSTPQDYVAAARADYRRLLTALYAAGYYSGVIDIYVNGREAAQIPPLDAPARIDTVRLVVQPGPLFRFGRAEVAPLAPETELPDGFATGEPAEADTIRAAATAARERWRDVGFAKVAVADQQITAIHAQDRLDAAVRLATGPRLTFGPLTIVGNEAVRTAAIARIAGLPTGEIYSPQEITDAANRLRQTGAFDSVAFTEAEVIGPNDTLPITATVQESLPRRIGFGIELSSVEGLRVSTYWMHRNIFGGAENFRVDAEVAGIGGNATGGTDYSLSTALKIPAIYGAKTDATLTAALTREDEPDYLIDKFSIEFILDRALTDTLEVEGGVGLLTAREVTALGERQYTLLTAPFKATYDQRDEPTNAKNGYYIEAQATPFLAAGDTSSGLRGYMDARGYLSFGMDDRFTLAARGQVGTVIGPTLIQAPADFLFYSGGSGSVRGQAYKSLGIPVTRGGETILLGGKSFAGVQTEARIGFTEALSGVVFYDYAYVGAESTPLTDGGDQSGVGIGVRYNTGIGPIRLDIGTPASGPEQFGAVEVYIGIGQAF